MNVLITDSAYRRTLDASGFGRLPHHPYQDMTDRTTVSASNFTPTFARLDMPGVAFELAYSALPTPLTFPTTPHPIYPPLPTPATVELHHASPLADMQHATKPHLQFGVGRSPVDFPEQPGGVPRTSHVRWTDITGAHCYLHRFPVPRRLGGSPIAVHSDTCSKRLFRWHRATEQPPARVPLPAIRQHRYSGGQCRPVTLPLFPLGVVLVFPVVRPVIPGACPWRTPAVPGMTTFW